MNWFAKLLNTFNPTPTPLPPNSVVIDVRSPGEYASGHVDGALNLPLDRIATDIVQQVPDRDQPLVLYCQSGMRSGSACAVLAQLGYTSVVNGGSAGAVALQTGKAIVKG
jgi:phage shock protein E